MRRGNIDNVIISIFEIYPIESVNAPVVDQMLALYNISMSYIKVKINLDSFLKTKKKAYRCPLEKFNRKAIYKPPKGRIDVYKKPLSLYTFIFADFKT